MSGSKNHQIDWKARAEAAEGKLATANDAWESIKPMIKDSSFYQKGPLGTRLTEALAQIEQPQLQPDHVGQLAKAIQSCPDCFVSDRDADSFSFRACAQHRNVEQPQPPSVAERDELEWFIVQGRNREFSWDIADAILAARYRKVTIVS